jgi:hypothetical protein
VERGDVGVDGQSKPIDVERLELVDELVGGRLERAVAQAPAVERRESPVLERQANRRRAMSRGRRPFDEERPKAGGRALNRAQLGVERVNKSTRRRTDRDTVRLVAAAAAASRSTLPVATEWPVTRKSRTSETVCADAGAAGKPSDATARTRTAYLVIVIFELDAIGSHWSA